MIFNRMESAEKKNTSKYLLGFDLGNKTSQISYVADGEEEIETLSVITGTKQYNIPTVLFKRDGVNQWFFGKEAIKKRDTEEGTFLDDLVEKARDGQNIIVEGEEKNPIALLTLFVKRSLGLFSMIAGTEKIISLMLTCDNLDHCMVEVLQKVVAGLGMKHCEISFQSHVESFYYYNIFQPVQLWDYDVLLCDFHERYLKTYRMECNKKTTPIVAYVENRGHGEMRIPIGNLERPYELDDKFKAIMEEVCEGHIISSVYLIGDGFQEEWMDESLKFLCRNRRVFMGNNLYSKGACYALRERQEKSEVGKTHVFLGNEKLKANIGMHVLRRGEESYLALMDAGVNWFEARKECDVILENGQEFKILITPLTKKAQVEKPIVLEEMVLRPDRATRLHLSLHCTSESILHIRVEDKGFGEIYPSSHKVWEQDIDISR